MPVLDASLLKLERLGIREIVRDDPHLNPEVDRRKLRDDGGVMLVSPRDQMSTSSRSFADPERSIEVRPPVLVDVGHHNFIKQFRNVVGCTFGWPWPLPTDPVSAESPMLFVPPGVPPVRGLNPPVWVCAGS